MELFSTRVWIAWLLIPALAVALQAQSSSVSIVKKYRNKDGKIVEERITKSGDDAESFDVNKYVESAQKDEIVELKVSKIDKRGNQSSVNIMGDNKAPRTRSERRQQREFTDRPGEVIILDRRGVDGLPLPPNAPFPPDAPDAPAPPFPDGAGSREITIDVEGMEDVDFDAPGQEERQVRIRINKNGQIEERIINIDRAMERGLEEMERGLEQMELEFDDLGRELEQLGNCNSSSRGNGSSFSWTEKTTDHKACLGIYPETVSGKKGARVTGFTGYSPAEDAGMTEGDIITSIDGMEVQDYSSLTKVLSEKKVGQSVTVSYTRDGKAQRTELPLKSCDGANNTACLGVYTDTYRQNDTKAGAQINEFSRVSPARTAGLQEGDIIIAINDRAVKSEGAVAHLLSAFQPGDEVRVKYQRNGKVSTQTVRLKDCNDNSPSAPQLGRRGVPMRDNCDENDAFLGVVASITIETTGDETRREGESTQGFLVSSVTSNSPAEVAGLQSGDIITSIDNNPILSFDDLEAFMQKQKPGTNVDVRFLRDGKSEQRTVQLKSCKDRNARERVIVSERGKGDRERRTIILRKPAAQDTRVNEAPTQPIDANERSLNLTNFTAFPNPAQGKVTVNFDAEAAPTIVSILDMSGRQVFSEELNTFNGNYNREFDLSEYANTTLIIRVSQGTKAWSERIVIAK